MKIVVISPNASHLHQVTSVLQPAGHEVLVFEGGKSRMNEIALQHEPDLMLVDGMCRDPAELAHIEQMTSAHHSTAVVLLCAQQTPDFLLASMRVGVREVLPSPASPQALLAAVSRVAARMTKGPGKRRGKVLGFLSCKGGSGSTFLATNLGAVLAESASVLLIDLNLQFGDALSFLHDGRAPATLADVSKEIARLDGSLLAASTVKVMPNYSVLAAPEELAQSMEVKPEHVDAIITLACTQHDFVILDLPRTLDPVSVKGLDAAWRAFLVMQCGLPELRNAAKMLQAFQSLGYTTDKIEVLLNRYEKSAEIGMDEVRKALGETKLRTIANAYKDVSASINHGDPLTRTGRSTPIARQITDLAQVLSPRPEPSRGLMDRLFRRA